MGKRVAMIAGALAIATGWAVTHGVAAPPPPKWDALPQGADAPDATTIERGAEIYTGRCAGCHEQGAARAPGFAMLRIMAPQSIYRTLAHGIMKDVVPDLPDADRKAVAEFLSQRRIAAAPPPPVMCDKTASAFDFDEPPPLPGWGFGAGNDHAIAPAVAGIGKAALPRLTLKWAFAYPDAVRARSQPALGGGALFVGSHDGTVFALDRRSGCVRWSYHAGAEVRSAPILSTWQAGARAARPALYFGDLVGNLYALDATTGAQLWRVKADPHPFATLTAAPALFEGKLIVPVSSLEEGTSADPRYPCCTFRGSLVAYDAKSGAQLWRTYMVDPPLPQPATAAGAKHFGPSGVAIWSSPTVDARRRRVYVTTGDNYTEPATKLSDAIVALDVDSGRIAWSHQATEGDAWNTGCMLPKPNSCDDDAAPDHDFGATPVLAKGSDGRELLLAGQKSGIVYALDPDKGTLRWQARVGVGGLGGGIVFGMAAQDGRLFVPVTDMVVDPKAPPGKPGVHALDIATGRPLWSHAGPACPANGDARCWNGYYAVPTAIGDIVLVGGDDGKLLALDAKSGAVAWSYDTQQDIRTLNGTTARGGSIGGAQGPIAFGGMLFANSGYGFASRTPGNVLLAFGVK